jgi:hypothetical protein
MMAFWSNWFPNIVCTFGGCLLSWAIGYRQGKVAAEATARQLRMSQTLLTQGEEQGHYKLARDKDGNITGGRIIELAATGTARPSATVDLKTGPSTMAGSGTVTPRGDASTASPAATKIPSP